jgi:galactosylceramidase
MKGNELTGFVDGKKLAAVTDASRAKGMAFLASTYDHNLFDNVRVEPIPAEARR